MRQFPPIINGIIDKSGFNLNTISKISGISHTYLTKLIKGNINRPGKDKIASILLALNYSIEAINQVLADYDYRLLDKLDIPDILKNNSRRKIEGSTLHLYELIYTRLLLSPMERLGGTKILIKNQPSALFLPDPLYLKDEHTYEKNDESRKFLYDLNIALLKERKQIFKKSCRQKSRLETYICRHCLEEFLEKNLVNPPEEGRRNHQKQVVRFFANALNAIKRNPEEHRIRIVDRCASFVFQIQNAEGNHPRVFFLGQKPHRFDNEKNQMTLKGFLSDSPQMVGLFLKEAQFCREATSIEINDNYPENLYAYWRQLFARNGLEGDLEDALAVLMDRAELTFY